MKTQHYHFIGIGGIGMSGLARILLKQNISVSGSDLSASYMVEKLQAEGAKVFLGHQPENIKEGMHVIYTTGVNEGNAEYAEAKRLSCPLFHRSDMLHMLMQKQAGIAVAGTHGKTTTSALLASVLEDAGLDPSFAIGGNVLAYGTNAKCGPGKYFVAETCESDGTFLKYDPIAAIVTNIDLDHMDFYETEHSLLATFQAFINKIQDPRLLFWCKDDLRLQKLQPPGISYGFAADADVSILEARQDGWQLKMTIHFKGCTYTDIILPMIGKHSALNGAAVFGLCLQLGVPEDKIRKGLTSFQGVGRRCEKKGEVRGVCVIDDYAHHPIEIDTTLRGIKKACGDRRLIAVFQPHRYTRTQDCMDEFTKCFSAADEVIITDIYSAQENAIPGINSQKLVALMSEHFIGSITYIPTNQLLDYVVSKARPHDVIVTLGAGDITHLGNKLIQTWKDMPPRKWRVGVVFGGLFNKV